MLEDSIGRLTGRINQLKTDQSQLEQQSAEQELKPLEAMLETQQAQVQRIESELAEITKQMSVVREDNDSLTKRLDERRRDAQHLGGRLASLEAFSSRVRSGWRGTSVSRGSWPQRAAKSRRAP